MQIKLKPQKHQQQHQNQVQLHCLTISRTSIKYLVTFITAIINDDNWAAKHQPKVRCHSHRVAVAVHYRYF